MPRRWATKGHLGEALVNQSVMSNYLTPLWFGFQNLTFFVFIPDDIAMAMPTINIHLYLLDTIDLF